MRVNGLLERIEKRPGDKYERWTGIIKDDDTLRTVDIGIPERLRGEHASILGPVLDGKATRVSVVVQSRGWKDRVYFDVDHIELSKDKPAEVAVK